MGADLSKSCSEHQSFVPNTNSFDLISNSSGEPRTDPLKFRAADLLDGILDRSLKSSCTSSCAKAELFGFGDVRRSSTRGLPRVSDFQFFGSRPSPRGRAWLRRSVN